MISIQEVKFASPEYQTLLDLRYDVLRKPIHMKLRPEDTALDEGEYHIAAMDGKRIIGCVLLRPLDQTTIRLRQMAVLPDYQGQGIGAQLVIFAENLARERGFQTVETKARKTAQGFYEKQGYVVVGDEFLEVSLHTIKMIKAV